MTRVVAPRIEAFRLPVGDGYRFGLLRNGVPGVASRGAILFVHAFAEEMNKSRRAIAVAARRLAATGWSVLQIDLEGCGESPGDFLDARWEHWQDDICRAADWLARKGMELRIVWGLRLGALLAASVVDRFRPHPDLLLWQPVLNGKTHLTQFLRLKAFEDMSLQGTGQQRITARLRASLASGGVVEVAGYNINTQLASAIDAADLSVPAGFSGRIYWLETARVDKPALAPASLQRADALRAAGCQVIARAVDGPNFWQTVEIEEAPALVEATVALLENWLPRSTSA